MKESGIYKITCISNKKIYIGSAVNIKVRWNRHRNELKNNKHVNIILQNSYNKYGLECFTFEIVEYVEEIKNLCEREQYYLNTLKPFGKFGFNISTTAMGGNDLNKHPNKKEIFKKISKSKSEQHLTVSDEHKAYLSKKLSEYFSENDHPSKDKTYEELYGIKKSNKIKEKISKNNKTKSGEENPFYNKTHTIQARNEISKARMGKYFGEQNIEIIINGETYRSYGLAATKFGVKPATIRYRCLSKNVKYKNYIIK